MCVDFQSAHTLAVPLALGPHQAGLTAPSQLWPPPCALPTPQHCLYCPTPRPSLSPGAILPGAAGSTSTPRSGSPVPQSSYSLR